MFPKKSLQIVLLAAAALIFPVRMACANVGIPMIALQLPLMVVLLLPVVIIEAVLLRHYLFSDFRSSLFVSIKANVFSTFIGFPIAWLLHFVLGYLAAWPLISFFENHDRSDWLECFIFSLTASWIPPIEGERLFLTLPTAGLVSLLPAYFMSVWIESAFIKRYAFSMGLNPKNVMFRVNFFSYALLAGIWFIQLYFSITSKDASLLFPFE